MDDVGKADVGKDDAGAVRFFEETFVVGLAICDFNFQCIPFSMSTASPFITGEYSNPFWLKVVALAPKHETRTVLRDLSSNADCCFATCCLALRASCDIDTNSYIWPSCHPLSSTVFILITFPPIYLTPQAELRDELLPIDHDHHQDLAVLLLRVLALPVTLMACLTMTPLLHKTSDVEEERSKEEK